MSAKLAIVSGPLTGAVFTLEGEVSIGRDRDNAIRFAHDEPLVSRHHCVIEPVDDGFLIRDLNSRNGTFVNGELITQRMLGHGDRIQIGDHHLVLLTRDDSLPIESSGIDIGENATPFEQTLELPRDQALYISGTRAAAAMVHSERVAHDLAALLRISETINSVIALEDLQTSLLELIFEITPSERGAILFGHDTQEIGSIFSLLRNKQGTHTVKTRISKTLLGRVLESGRGCIANNIPSDDLLRPRASLKDVQSVLCVPLKLREETIGAIYLDTRDPLGIFDSDHLQLLTGVAAIAAGALERGKRLELLAEENVRLQNEVTRTSEIVGVSRQTEELRALIARIAARDLWVLIEGETGAGKELVARALHRFSTRSTGPFVAINCAAIPETLFESELFGNTAKAFTHAGERKGLIEEANRGTLFLDEIGDMPLALQAKLLTVLDHGIVRRLGSNEERPVNFRLISATNKDLQKAIQDKTFRLDLFYKLHHCVVRIPPLRERPEDIEPLARLFLQRAAEAFKCSVHDFSADSLAFLKQHDWPGNVRELDFMIRSAVGVCESDVIQRKDFSVRSPSPSITSGIGMGTWDEALQEARRDIILRVMRQTEGDYGKAARLLGMHTNNLHKLITNLGIREDIETIRKDRKSN